MELFAHDIYLYVIALGGQTTGPNWLNFYNGIPGNVEIIIKKLIIMIIKTLTTPGAPAGYLYHNLLSKKLYNPRMYIWGNL